MRYLLIIIALLAVVLAVLFTVPLVKRWYGKNKNYWK